MSDKQARVGVGVFIWKEGKFLLGDIPDTTKPLVRAMLEKS